MKKISPLKCTLLTCAFLLIYVNGNTQDLEQVAARMQLRDQEQNAAKANILLIRPFEEWQGDYDWKHGASRNIDDYGFQSYTKFTQSGKRFGIIKLPEDTLTQAVFDEVWSANSDGVLIVNNNKVGMIDTLGKLIIPAEYDHITTFNEGRAFVKRNKKYALITYSGKQLTPFLYDQIGGFSCGRCPVMANGKLGYIDKNGAYIIQPRFNDATNFFSGFARIYSAEWESVLKAKVYQAGARTNVNYGYTKKIPFLINKRGKRIFDGEWGDEISISENGYAIITRNWSDIVIDTTGKILLPLDRKLSVQFMTPDWIVVHNRNNKVMGVINYKGEELLKPTFSSIESLKYNNNTLGKAFFDEGNFFYIDKKCNCVEYDGVKCPDKG